MSGSTVGVAGMALVGLGIGGALLVGGPRSNQAPSPNPAAWESQLRGENALAPVNWRAEAPAGTVPAGEQVRYRYVTDSSGRPIEALDIDGDGDNDPTVDQSKNLIGDGPPMHRYFD